MTSTFSLKILALSTFLISTGINISIAQDLEPYEGARVKNIQNCIASGDPDKKISGGGKNVYAIGKMGRFNVVDVQAFDGRGSRFKYESNSKKPEQGKCYTKQKEKFTKDRGVCCLKLRAATALERIKLKQNLVCELTGLQSRNSVYNLKSSEAIDFVGENNCNAIEEAFKPVDKIGEMLDKRESEFCKVPFKPFELPPECKGRI